MLRLLAPVAAATFAMTLAAPASARTSEIGYPQGSLAVGALANGDYRTSERVLAPVSAEDAQDPARLINIAYVYARTNRLAEARAALLAARAAPPTMLVLADGRELSSRTAADSALRSLGASYAAR